MNICNIRAATNDSDNSNKKFVDQAFHCITKQTIEEHKIANDVIKQDITKIVALIFKKKNV